MALVDIVIPIRAGGNCEVTLRSLHQQTFRDFRILYSRDQRGNANWARNEGFRHVTAPYVLFSDDDIRWDRHGLRSLVTCLETHPEAAYSYGAYHMPGRGLLCARSFDAARLRAANYISTMSLIRTRDFPGFDEGIQRLQDWDLWLTMLEQGKIGVYCGQRIFATDAGNGITFGADALPYEEAKRIVREKHGLAVVS